jgi:hypothetical protein
MHEEITGVENSLAELAGTRNPMSSHTLADIGRPHQADAPPFDTTAVQRNQKLYWDSDRTRDAPPNFPNHTNALVVAEYGKKKPVRRFALNPLP